ncbi:MAG TPA: xanthine dehydrogenase family protein molybdopterin-binding subunit [Streptosporangiaceae bacterium]|nr:xanthine dehydrogenase family protein molybdopterin-binding subunit [Streptosporangiaceae bacterium]
MTDLSVADVAAPATDTTHVIGSQVPRKEDDRLLSGEGQFTDDVGRANTAEIAVGRSPYPHARIVRLDPSAALDLPGVLEVITGADVAAATAPIGILRPVPGAPAIPHYALAERIATYEGQPVVSVAATSRAVAEDALDLIEIEYEPLPHVTDLLAALAPGAPVIHPGVLESNLLVSNPQGAGDAPARLKEADVRVEGRFFINRVTGLPMETRAILAEWRARSGALTVHVSTQAPHLIRKQLAESLRIGESEIRVVASDVGGGFGLKLGIYPEDLLACLHARSLRRPVKFVEDRNEHFRATTHGRESVHDYVIGARADGRILAMTDVYMNDLGGLNSPFGSSQLSTVVFNGPYKVDDGFVERRVVVTNKTPIGAYRGYGQPEVNFAYERLMDKLARRLGMDAVELRAMNMVRPDQFPWVNPVGAAYDSGDYEGCLRMAAEAIGWAGHRRAGHGPRGADGRYVGVGFSSFVERTGYASGKFLAARGSDFGAHESVTIRANRSGTLDVYTGVSSIGQGSETVFAQMCAEFFGCDYDAVTVHTGDTASSPLNTGSFASRTVIAAAGALQDACGRIRAKTLRIAAHMLGVDHPEQLDIIGRAVQHRDDLTLMVPLSDVFDRAILGQGLPDDESPGLDETAYFDPPHAAYSFGTAAAVVAVDAESGEFDVERFLMVHDCGTPLNPKLIEGQVRGGLAQGLGQALGEELVYDPETGQLVNGTMMDYFAPTACDLPPIELMHTAVSSPVTPLGVRGAGEVGAIPAAAAVANAICDALTEFGVELDRLPLTPELVWRALRGTSAART